MRGPRIGQVVEDIMNEHNITSQAVVAEMLDISITTLRNYISGKSYPSIKEAVRIAGILDKEVLWLWVFDNEE